MQVNPTVVFFGWLKGMASALVVRIGWLAAPAPGWPMSLIPMRTIMDSMPGWAGTSRSRRACRQSFFHPGLAKRRERG
jgi:hypothetical protein